MSKQQRAPSRARCGLRAGVVRDWLCIPLDIPLSSAIQWRYTATQKVTHTMQTIDQIPTEALFAHPAIATHIEGARQALQDREDATTAAEAEAADGRYSRHAARALAAVLAVDAAMKAA